MDYYFGIKLVNTLIMSLNFKSVIRLLTERIRNASVFFLNFWSTVRSGIKNVIRSGQKLPFCPLFSLVMPRIKVIEFRTLREMSDSWGWGVFYSGPLICRFHLKSR